MALFDKVSVKLMKKALASYLPHTRTEIVSLSSPIATPAIRVWFNDEDAHDYFVSNRSWWVTSANNAFNLPPDNTTVGANTGAQLLSAVIAGSIASSYRPIAYPLESDFRIGDVADAVTVQEAQNRMLEPYQFLIALSNGEVPFTDGANTLAFQLIQGLNSEIEQHRGEAASA